MKLQLNQLSHVRDLLAKAELAKNLLEYLQETDVQTVITFLLEEGIMYEDEKVDYDFSEVEIRCIADPIKFGDIATMKNSCMEHSWAGSDEFKQDGWVILGDLELGSQSKSQYSQNGDYRSPIESYYPPNFSINEIQILLVRTQIDDTFNNRDYHSVGWCLYIYQPNEYSPPDWVKDLAEKFSW